MGVAVPGNPCPVAVGVAVCSREDALARQTGKLVEVKQVRGYTPYILFRLAKFKSVQALAAEMRWPGKLASWWR